MPALIAGLVLLLANGVGAVGLDVCLHHGSHGPDQEHTDLEGEGHEQRPGSHGENGPPHHGSHGHHPHYGPGHPDSEHPVPPSHTGHDHSHDHPCDHHHHAQKAQGSHHDHPAGEPDCDFRILCVGAAGLAPLEPQLEQWEDPVDTGPAFAPPPEGAELQPALVPFFLPFPNAPPAHS